MSKGGGCMSGGVGWGLHEREWGGGGSCMCVEVVHVVHA